MKTLERKSVTFIREANLTPKQVKILTNKGFIVCFKEVDDWGLDIYAIYA
jgi:hypothetical protein